MSAKIASVKPSGDASSEKLPTNVVLVNGCRVPRYGVKMRFLGLYFRIGSQYCDPKSANTVVELFRACTVIDKESNLTFNEAKLDKYRDFKIRVFWPFPTVPNEVSVVEWMEKWLSKWQKKKRNSTSTSDGKPRAKRRKSCSATGAGACLENEDHSSEETLFTDPDDPSEEFYSPTAGKKSNLTMAEAKLMKTIVKALEVTGLAMERPSSDEDEPWQHIVKRRRPVSVARPSQIYKQPIEDEQRPDGKISTPRSTCIGKTPGDLGPSELTFRLPKKRSSTARVYDECSVSLVENSKGIKLIVSLPEFKLQSSSETMEFSSYSEANNSTRDINSSCPVAIERVSPGTVLITSVPTAMIVYLAEGIYENLKACICKGSTTLIVPYSTVTTNSGVFVLQTTNLEPGKYTLFLVGNEGAALTNAVTFDVFQDTMNLDLPDDCDEIFDDEGDDPNGGNNSNNGSHNKFSDGMHGPTNGGEWGTSNSGNGDGRSDFDIWAHFNDTDAFKCAGTREKVIINFEEPEKGPGFHKQSVFSSSLNMTLVSVIVGIFSWLIYYGQFAGLPAVVLQHSLILVKSGVAAACTFLINNEQCSSLGQSKMTLQGGISKGVFQTHSRKPFSYYFLLQEWQWVLCPLVLVSFFCSKKTAESPRHRDHQFMKIMQVVCLIEGFLLYASGIHLGFLIPSAVLASFGIFWDRFGLKYPIEEKYRKRYVARQAIVYFSLAAVMEAAVCQYFGPGSFSGKYGAHVILVHPPISRKLVSVNIILINLTQKANVRHSRKYLKELPLQLVFLCSLLGYIGGMTVYQSIDLWFSMIFQMSFLFLALSVVIKKSGMLTTFFEHLERKGWWRPAEKSYW